MLKHIVPLLAKNDLNIIVIIAKVTLLIALGVLVDASINYLIEHV
ncbi:MAG: hypothetical protein QW596_01425 [Sulfolobales archaeon]